MKLPIDVIPGTTPPRFQWRQKISSPGGGNRTIKHVGQIPPPLEGTIIELIALVKQLMSDNETLTKINKGFADRIAAQSELLSKRAEHAEEVKPGAATLPMPQPPGRKHK